MASQDEDTSPFRVRDLLRRAASRRVAVLGSGVTGRAVARLLTRAGYQVTVFDERQISAGAEAELTELGAKWCDQINALQDRERLLPPGSFAFAVFSPGIGLDGDLARALSLSGIPKLSEIDLAVAYLGMPEVAITGTNGKTTTVNLISQMLNRSGLSAELVGNVGNPFVGLINPRRLTAPEQTAERDERRPLLVAEVSSYQLEAAIDFAPHVAAWLNLTDDHLERHGSMEHYLRIKARIFAGQDSERDYALINMDDPYAAKMRTLVRANFIPLGVVTVERAAEVRGCFFDSAREEIIFKLDGSEEIYSTEGTKLRGEHNRLNLCCAIASARLSGATHEAIQRVIDEFQPLAHRIELVRELNGVFYINDSKATNVSATAAAMDTINNDYPNSNIVLLLGGKAKLGRWDDVLKRLPNRVKLVITFGGDREMIANEVETYLAKHRESPWAKRLTHLSVPWLAEAVRESKRMAVPGDVVLLSPGCASFDAYSDYTARGRHFRELVEEE